MIWLLLLLTQLPPHAQYPTEWELTDLQYTDITPSYWGWAQCMTGPHEKLHHCTAYGVITYDELTHDQTAEWHGRDCTLRKWHETCARFDCDHDDDIDLRDFALWTLRQSRGELTLDECKELAPYLVPGG